MATITIGIDSNGKVFSRSSFEKALNLTPDEQRAIDIVYEALTTLSTEDADIHVEQKSTNYLSVVAFEVYDFLRLKIGEKAKWFSIATYSFSKADRSDLSEDIRFATVENKKQNHWKISLASAEQLKEYQDLIQRAYAAAKQSHEKDLSK